MTYASLFWEGWRLCKIPDHGFNLPSVPGLDTYSLDVGRISAHSIVRMT